MNLQRNNQSERSDRFKSHWEEFAPALTLALSPGERGNVTPAALQVTRECGSVVGSEKFGIAAFSLLEVMVAIAIFFSAAFAILTVVSSAVRNAGMLQRPQVDAAAVASVFSLTNKIFEGTSSGDLSDMLGETYRGYTWESTSIEVQSNKLFQVDFTIYSPAQGHPVFSRISTRLYRPESPPGMLDGGLGVH